MYVRISSRVVIYLPKMPACPHAFPPAHPHETHHVCVFFLRDIYFGFIFILVFFYLLIYFLPSIFAQYSRYPWYSPFFCYPVYLPSILVTHDILSVILFIYTQHIYPVFLSPMVFCLSPPSPFSHLCLPLPFSLHTYLSCNSSHYMRTTSTLIFYFLYIYSGIHGQSRAAKACISSDVSTAFLPLARGSSRY